MSWTSPLAPHLEAAGAALARREQCSCAVDFGDPAGELRAAREAAGLSDWSFRGRLELRGQDRLRFLQGQCTQDVAGLAENGSAYAFVLDPKGRNVSDLEILKRRDALLALVVRPQLAALRAWLDRFVIASDVTLTDRSEDAGLLRLTGPATADVLAAAGFPPSPETDGAVVVTAVDGHELLLGADDTTLLPGVLLHAPAAALRGLWDRIAEVGRAHGLRPVGYDAIDALRIENGRPWFGHDLDETVLPVESGQLARAVSFEKGCYTGQEVVARQHFIGKPRKLLCGLLLEGAELREGDPVFGDEGERPLGRISSLADLPWREARLALAVLRGHEHPPGTVHAVRPEDGRAAGTATVAPLPFPS